MTTIALLPIKNLSYSKTRLSRVLGPGERRHLSYKLFTHVWKTCVSAGVKPVAVTSDPGLLAKIRRYAVRDDATSLNDALVKAITLIRPKSFFVILPDLPLIRPDVLKKVISLEARYVVCPDRWLKGTNAVYVNNYRDFVPMFGPNSFTRHMRQRRDAKIFYSLETAFDVDVPSDLSLLRFLSPGFAAENKQRNHQNQRNQ